MFTETTATSAFLLVADEVEDLASRVSAGDGAALATVADLIAGAGRMFTHGAGRSGLALRMTAMRLMHLGIETHVVGETTTPAIRSGDVLLLASGSGTTPSVVRAAETAGRAGATVIAVTAAAGSPLARLAAATVLLPAATKTDRSAIASAQYAGSLFEQGLVLLGDALFHTLWQHSGRSADDLWPTHANLE
ncbi:6-phospho-3-hexuloisomerase [Actinoplanes sp. NBRC 101535]|uniref:6-phospho-3-hexuloisomerase n=1 Tax=Actinoplanes sp. NBRC 101535 TaxID=3032196 RepID=UPI0024A5629B|nr:6-phospho-3-hexuloisomerase [Actinoplanes sp. NBRC 101535]GLY06624.1 6-phospho 3-hexuloisomerase [Actinoplanes sp. NBRC 101535]